LKNGLRFHTFTHPEFRCVRLLVKHLGRIRLSVITDGVKQQPSGRRARNPLKKRPSQPHIIVSLAIGPEVSKVRWLTELYGLRVLV